MFPERMWERNTLYLATETYQYSNLDEMTILKKKKKKNHTGNVFLAIWQDNEYTTVNGELQEKATKKGWAD